MGLMSSQSIAQKTCVIEEFSSSTCVPCAGMNAWLDPLFKTNNANVENSGLAVVKYQMYFPSPGNDASYNQMGRDRANYYIAGMPSWGIPLHFTNGKYEDTFTTGPNMGGTDQTLVQPEITACKGGTAQVKLSGSYRIKSLSATDDSIFISVTVNPTATLTGTYYLIVDATERYYKNNGATTTQKDYYHVMRKMYPGSAGTPVTNLTANTPQTFTFADKITVSAAPTQMSNTWWDNPYDGNVVAFLEDHTPTLRAQTRVLNGVAIPAQWVTGVNTVSNFQNIKVMPNPATDQAVVCFNVSSPTNVSVNVTDIMGRTVYTVAPTTVGVNAQTIIIPTSEFANGVYNVTLRSDDGSQLSQRLVVSK